MNNSESINKVLIGIFIGIMSTLLATLFKEWIRKTWDYTVRMFWDLTTRLTVHQKIRWIVIHSYINKLRQQIGTVTNIYLDRKETLELQNIFIPLRLRDRTGKGLSHKHHSTRTILTSPQNQKLIILGDPGSGKTTLLKSLATGTSGQEWSELRNYFPVFASLRNFSQQQTNASFEEWLVETILPIYSLRNGRLFLQHIVEEGRLLLLLDGLDETNDNLTESVINRIMKYIDKWKKTTNRVIITCRGQNFDILADTTVFNRSNFIQYQLSEMRDSEIEAFVQCRWKDFVAHNKSANQFLRSVYLAGINIVDLHRNPLLLTLSISLYLYRVDESIPHTQFAFFEESLNHLLRRRDFLTLGNEGKINLYNARDKLKLLQHFALFSMEQATKSGKDFGEFYVSEIVDKAQALARDNLAIKDEDAEEIVKELHRNAGLIIDSGDGTHFMFAHRSFHEFCAAQMLVSLGDKGFNIICNHLDEASWHQTIIFYAGGEHSKVDNLIKKLIDSNNKSEYDSPSNIIRLILAGKCAAVLSGPRVPLRHLVCSKLLDALNLDDHQINYLLLSTLLNFLHNSPKEILHSVKKRMFILVENRTIECIISELQQYSRIAPLTLLQLLTMDDNDEHQKIALLGLEQLEGVEKVDLLWQLLEKFYSSENLSKMNIVRKQLIKLMPVDGFTERLNNQFPLFKNLLDENLVRDVFPFKKNNELLPNIAYLLYLEASSRKREHKLIEWHPKGSTWESLLAASVTPKTEQTQIAWRKLRDYDRKKNRRIPSDFIGKLLFMTGVFSLIIPSTIFYLPTGINRDILFGSVLIGFILNGIWPIWRSIGQNEDYSFLDRFSSIPDFIRVLLLKPKNEHFFINFIRLFLRIIAFSLISCCYVPLAILIKNGRNDIIYDSFDSFIFIDVAIIFLHFCFFFLLPTIKYFDEGKFLIFCKNNIFQPLFNLKGIERWIPEDR